MTDGATVQRLIPEILLIMGASALFVASAFRVSATLLSLGGRAILLLAVLFLVGPGSRATIEPGAILFGDTLSLAIRWIALASGAIFVYGSSRSGRHDSLEGERIGSALLVFAGCMLVGLAADLSFLFVAMELVSIPTYGLLFLGRRDEGSSEAAIKYFLLSIFSSAFFLYGLAWIYMLTGTTSLHPVDTAGFVMHHGWHGMLPWAVLLVFLGLGFKLAAFPMQFYAPDVYQGASPMNAGLLAVAPKIAGVAGLLRLFGAWGPQFDPSLLAIAAVIPILTMTIGNVGALWQKQVRRMLAYSSIAHGGYLLIGVVVVVAGGWPDGWVDGAGAILLYLMVYAIASLGTFCALSGLRRAGQEPEQLEELAGLAKGDPGTACALSICMFSMAGIPPLAGFWGKLGLFGGAVHLAQIANTSRSTSHWLLALAIVGALNAAVAAAYYLRIVGTICFRESVSAEIPRADSNSRQVAVLCAVVLVVIGCYPQAFISGFRGAARSSQHVVSSVPREAVAPSRYVESLAAQD